VKGGEPIRDARVVGQAGILRRIQVIWGNVLVLVQRIGRGVDRMGWLSMGTVVGEEWMGR
jgi:hypothetical protein